MLDNYILFVNPIKIIFSFKKLQTKIHYSNLYMTKDVLNKKK